MGPSTEPDAGHSIGPDEEHQAERYFLIVWCFLVLLGSLVGNSIILLATVNSKTIRLDKASIVLIKNIAVSDMMMGMVGVHPVLASLIHGTWPYGTAFCYIFHYVQVPFYVSAVFLICGLHINKLYTVIHPLRYVSRSSRNGHIISAVAWLLSTLFPVTQIIVDFKSVMYVEKIYRCMYSYKNPLWEWLLPLVGTVCTAFPNIMVGGTTAALIFLVRRTKGRFNRQGILTALHVGCWYLLANMPVSVEMLVFRNIRQFMSSKADLFFDFYFYRASYFMLFINCSCNVFVYYCSIKSFNIFVKRGLSFLFRRRTFGPDAENFRLRTFNFRRS